MAVTDIHVDPQMTRDLQRSARAVRANLARMQEWGAYNLVKVRTLGDGAAAELDAFGYITVLAAISGRTPAQMVRVLGLREGIDLLDGAAIYQLQRLPGESEFNVRGYTTLPDGLRLKPGVRADSGGFGPGHGAWQVQLTSAIPARLMATVHPGKTFDPPLHPRTAAMYARR